MSLVDSSASSFAPAARVQSFGTTVFSEFTALAQEKNAVNLGQGFPDFSAPDFIIQAAQDALERDLNQYSRGAGHPRLVDALSTVYSPLFNRSLDPMSEIVVTVGATEGIFATVQALVNPGDEVVLIEPFYDSYPASVIMAGGIPVYVPLRPETGARASGEWHLDLAELEAAFGERTRLLILNTPHNPVGKVFTYDELEAIASLVKKYDVLVLSDEVYEWMVYGGVKHQRIATLPGMWDRTVTLGSAGKTFSVTGWKIGWAIAPAHLSGAVLKAHQWIPFCVATPLQEAVAIAFEQAEKRGYFDELKSIYEGKRDKLQKALTDAGLPPMTPDGSYFILVETSHLTAWDGGTGSADEMTTDGSLRDVDICRWLTEKIGVAAIPPSAFYNPQHKELAANLARFCFCKTDSVLDEAAKRLRANL